MALLLTGALLYAAPKAAAPVIAFELLRGPNHLRAVTMCAVYFLQQETQKKRRRKKKPGLVK